jgi:hypothetical protein
VFSRQNNKQEIVTSSLEEFDYIQIYLLVCQPFKAYCLVHQQVSHLRIIRSAHTVFTCFVFISEQTATSAPYNVDSLVFITGMKSVYSAVRTGSLNKAVCASSLEGYRINYSNNRRSEDDLTRPSCYIVFSFTGKN